MRTGILVLVAGLGACKGAYRSGTGGGDPNDPEDWYAGTDMVGPLTFDATHTRYEYTLEGSIALTQSYRQSTREITGLAVIGEVTEIGTGARIQVTITREGEEPGPYGSKVAQGPYTYNHADPVVLEPLPSCYTPPCTATERYKLTLDTVQNPGTIQLVWHATLHVLLADTEGDQLYPPEDDETLRVTLVPDAM